MPEGNMTAAPSPKVDQHLKAAQHARDAAQKSKDDADRKLAEAQDKAKETEDHEIAALRKKYEDAAKAATEAAPPPDILTVADPKYAELRAKKREAFEALHAAEDAQGKRMKADMRR